MIYAQSTDNTLSTYQNSTYGITIKYPTAWSYDETGGIDDTDVDIVTFFSPAQNNNATLDVHQVKLDNASNDIGNYLNFTTSSYKEELKNFNVIESDTNNSIAGNAAYKLIYTYTTDDGTKLKDIETGTLIGNNKIYYLVYDNLESDFEKDLPTVQSMIKSLQIYDSGSNNNVQNQQQTPLPSTTEPNGNGFNFISICNTIQMALYHSCSELVNPDGSLTILGQTTVKCILSGATMGGISSLVLPPKTVIGGLSALADPTGCDGLVKIDLLNSVGDIKGIVNQISRFNH